MMKHRSGTSLLDIGVETALRFLDREANLCLFSLDRSITFQGRAHDVSQSSVLLTTGLFKRHQDGDRQTAMAILRALGDAPTTENVGFQSTLLGQLAHAVTPQDVTAALTDEFHTLLGRAVLTSAQKVAARAENNIYRPGFTNYWLLDTAGLILAGQYLDDDEFLRRGCDKLDTFEAFHRGYDAPEEFVTPVYTPIQMAALVAMGTYAGDEAIAQRARSLEIWLWRHLLRHYDSEAQIIMGAWSRAYGQDRLGSQGYLIPMIAAAFEQQSPASWIAGQIADHHKKTGGATPYAEMRGIAWSVFWHVTPPTVEKKALDALLAQAGSCEDETIPPGRGIGRSARLVRTRGAGIDLSTVDYWDLSEQAVPLAVHRRGEKLPLLFHENACWDCPPVVCKSVTSEFYCTQHGLRAIVAAGYATPTPKTDSQVGVRSAPPMPLALECIGQNICLPGMSNDTRLLVDGRERPFVSQSLPPQTAIVLGTDEWSIGLVIGPPTTLGPGAGIDLEVDGLQSRIVMSHLRNERMIFTATTADVLYIWYYLVVSEHGGERDGASSLARRLGQVRVDDVAIDARRRRLCALDGEAQLTVAFDASIREAICWTSNGWRVRS